jgi:integrase/recombinase XerD
MDDWLADVAGLNRSPLTVQRYRDVVGAYVASLGPEATLDDLTAASLRVYIRDHLSLTHNAETLKREIGNIKTFGKWLEGEGYAQVDPFRRVKKPQTPHTEMRVLTQDDMDRLFDSFDKRKRDEQRDYLVVLLTLTTGLRISEVCTAKLADLNLDEGWLKVIGKGNKERRVPLHPKVRRLLLRWVRGDRRRWAKNDEYLFVSRVGTMLDRHRVSGRFRAKIQALNLPYRVRFHDLRHAAATWMRRQGMDLETVSQILGHANIGITSSIYNHLDFEDVQRAYEAAKPFRWLND